MWIIRALLVEHLAHGGDVVYRHACRLGCEGIVSKRLDSPYVSGRTRRWLKFKNPAAPGAPFGLIGPGSGVRGGPSTVPTSRRLRHRLPA